MLKIHSLFCDDFRAEVSGQYTFVGAYNGGLTLPACPAIIPQICVVVWIYAPFDEAAGLTFPMKIVLGDSVLSTNDVVFPKEIPQIPFDGNLTKDESTEKQISVVQMIRFSPLFIKEPALMRVRMNVNGEDMKGGSIWIGCGKIISPDNQSGLPE